MQWMARYARLPRNRPSVASSTSDLFGGDDPTTGRAHLRWVGVEVRDRPRAIRELLPAGVRRHAPPSACCVACPQCIEVRAARLIRRWPRADACVVPRPLRGDPDLARMMTTARARLEWALTIVPLSAAMVILLVI